MFKSCYTSLLSMIAAALIFSSSGAYASWSSSGPAFLFPLGVPADVRLGAHGSDLLIFHVRERANFTLLADVSLDDGKTISAGRIVNIDYFYTERLVPGTPINHSATLMSTTSILGTVTGGGGPAIGIASSVSFLPTDALAVAGSLFPNNSTRRLETNDTALLTSPTTIDVSWNTSTVQDAMRVFTAVPEPSTYMVLGSTLGLAMLLMYRRKRRAA